MLRLIAEYFTAREIVERIIKRFGESQGTSKRICQENSIERGLLTTGISYIG